jgi:hypothetical protein
LSIVTEFYPKRFAIDQHHAPAYIASMFSFSYSLLEIAMDPYYSEVEILDVPVDDENWWEGENVEMLDG